MGREEVMGKWRRGGEKGERGRKGDGGERRMGREAAQHSELWDRVSRQVGWPPQARASLTVCLPMPRASCAVSRDSDPPASRAAVGKEEGRGAEGPLVSLRSGRD